MPVYSEEERNAIRSQVTGGMPASRPVGDGKPLANPLAAPLTQWSGESTWDVWANPDLDPKSRSLVTVAIIATLGLPGPLSVHVRGALRNGARPEEVIQAVMHVAVYAGVSRAVDVMDTVVPAIEAYLAESG